MLAVARIGGTSTTLPRPLVLLTAPEKSKLRGRMEHYHYRCVTPEGVGQRWADSYSAVWAMNDLTDVMRKLIRRFDPATAGPFVRCRLLGGRRTVVRFWPVSAHL